MTSSTEPNGSTHDALQRAARLRAVLRHGGFFLRRMDGAGELTTQQVTLLAMLSEGDLRMTAIAANLGVRTPTATQSVDRLEKAGMVHRLPDTKDARAVLVGLTEQGRAVMAKEDAHRSRMVAEILAGLTQEELAILDAAMPILDRVASPHGGLTRKHPTRPVG